jgi:hypothetical protein
MKISFKIYAFIVILILFFLFFLLLLFQFKVIPIIDILVGGIFSLDNCYMYICLSSKIECKMYDIYLYKIKTSIFN